MWRKVCGIKTEDQGGILALSLTGTPRTLATNLPEEEIVAANGVEKVMEVLKKPYAKDSIDSKFKVLIELENFIRTDS